MVVVFDEEATETEIENVIKVMNEFGFDVHRSTGVSRTILGAIGVKPDFDHRQIQVLPGVDEVYRITEPYKLANRSFKPEGTVIDVKGVKIGGQEVVVMAGPCAVENEKQLMAVAEHVAKNGAKILRGGAFKPRTSPYSFQGMGEEGLKLLRKAGDAFGLVVVTEVMDRSQIEAVVQYADRTHATARFISVLPPLDSRLQVPSLLYEIAAHPGLVPGINLSVFLPSGPPQNGVVIPSGAVVWSQGTAWCYVEESPGKFVRTSVQTSEPVANGFFQAEGIFSGARVVIKGAQTLLSEEFRSQIQADQD